MGKSPAKWFKSVLFGKKSSSRSGSTKAKDLSKGASNKGYAVVGKEPAFSESSPVISEPVLVSAHNNETVSEVTKGDNSSLQGEVAVRDVNQDLEKQGIVGSEASSDPERLREEQAAVKTQAAFRGYLARRAFRALKGIIRLQALIRGHLVRRQAVSTLRATWLIVKFQALVRGRNVRLSRAAIQTSLKLSQQNFGGVKLGAWKEQLSSNAFARKLLSSPVVVEALHFQYDEMDPNSAFNWLKRWTITLKGYGESINYRMGLPLLKDVVQSMEEAIIAKEENRPDGTYEKARLRFAHAETVVPFSCLLGLFLEGSDFEKIQREEALDLPPVPPQGRNWKGSVVAPFAGNNMLVLYQCPGKVLDGSRTSGDQNNSYFIQVLHNEVPVSMPGCGNKDFCPFEEFKEKIVKPHLKHEYDMICKIKPPVARDEPASFSSRMSKFFTGLFSRKGYRVVSAEGVKTEL